MATVVYGDYEPFEIDDNRADLVAYYRGEGATVTLYGEAAPPAESDESDDGSPAKSATKGEWVDYAVSLGATQEDAEALTKAELIEQFGAD